MGTQQQSVNLNYQTSTSSLEDFLVKLSVWHEEGKDLKTQEVHSFLISQGFSPTKNPNILYSKMLKVYFLMTMEELCRKSLKFSPTLGIWCNGKYSIVKTSESHRVGKECILSDILEEKVDRKYFLSDKAKEYLIRAAKRRGAVVAKFHQL